MELKKDGIHVLTVCPGYVRTAFGKNAVRGNELKRVRPDSVRGITAERVARATLQGYLKAEEGSDRAVDDVRAAEDLSAISRAGGVGDGADGEVIQRRLHPYPSSASIASISDCACKLPVRRADAMPSVSIVLASAIRSARASVCAAMK